MQGPNYAAPSKRRSTGGHIAQVTILHGRPILDRWLHGTGGHSAMRWLDQMIDRKCLIEGSTRCWADPHPNEALAGSSCASPRKPSTTTLHRWPYCTGGHIAPMAILHRWPYCTGGRITQASIGKADRQPGPTLITYNL